METMKYRGFEISKFTTYSIWKDKIQVGDATDCDSLEEAKNWIDDNYPFTKKEIQERQKILKKLKEKIKKARQGK